MPAAKHFDPVLGVDTHIVLIPTPTGPLPTPIPHPYVGMVFDPMDYVPGLGGTVKVNGMMRAVAGTAGQATPPHIPLGGPFAKPPTNESEVFMGSISVNADGNPMSFAALPVLSCQDLGMPAPPRPKKKSAAKSLMLPTCVVMPIPSGPPVLVGGAPTIVMPGAEALLSPLAQGVVKARKALARKSKRFARAMQASSDRLQRLAGKVMAELGLTPSQRNKVHRSICAVTGHPVDIATGKMFTEFVDLRLAGPLAFELERVWFSTSTYQGPFGHGWHASFDLALAVDEQVLGVRLADGRVALFPALAEGESHYDARERLTLSRDQDGYALMDVQGRSYQFVSVRGRADRPLGALVDASGFSLRFEYGGPTGRLVAVRDSAGRAWHLEHDAAGRIVAIRGPHPNEPSQRVVYMQYAYDAQGNLIEARDALGGTQRFAYQRHLLVKETKKDGLSFYFEYDGRDENARCVHTWGDGGIYDHKLHYEPGQTRVTDSLGYQTTYVHDGAMVSKTLDAFGNLRSTEYGPGYRVMAEIDELGQRTSFAYDERGNLVERTGPDGAKLSIEYGPHDLPREVRDALGGQWCYTRDERGRVLERTDPLGRATRYHYSGPWLVGVTDPAGGRTVFGYDRSGNVDAVATPGGAVTRYAYDALGRVTAITDPKGNVQRRTLDLLGRVARVEEPDGNVRELAYDAEGNVLRAKDAQHDVRFRYQGMGRLASRSEADTTLRFEYDLEERLTGIVDEHGNAYRFKLGPTGAVDEEHGFDGLLRKYTRDKAGRVLRVERPSERFSAFKYDAGGRVVQVEHSDGGVERYGYRIDGALVCAASPDACVLFERDALGRIVKETQGAHWVQSEYDGRGQRVRMRSSLGAEQVIERGALGEVSRVSEASGFQVRFSRDALGLELERSLPGGLRSKWRRDALGLPLAHEVSGAGGQALRAVRYGWKPNERLCTLIDEIKGRTQYRHDARGKLAWAQYPDGGFELRMPDAVGNLFKREDRRDRSYGPAGQLLTQSTPRGEIHYAYDAEGNLIEKREPGGRVWRYAWSGAGMLAQVVRPDGSEVTFGYDALGRRVTKTYRGQTTKWVWDGDVPLHEWVEGRPKPRTLAEPAAPGDGGPLIHMREVELDALLARGASERGSKQAPITWLFEPESFAPLAKLVAGAQLSIITDHLGTPVLMADAEGKPCWSASLSTYGELRELEGLRHACPFRWAGQYEDAETGLYYNRFRYYDPEAGQYTSQDPIGLLGGKALYGYVHDPLTWADPLGLSGQGGCGGAARGVGKANAPKSTLPRDKSGNYLPDPAAEGRAHTVLGTREGRAGSYTQGATFDSNGVFKGVTDVTTHGRADHPMPHFHPATGPSSIQHGPHPLLEPTDLGP